MQRSTSLVTIAALLAFAACGDDGEDSPETPDQRPGMQQPASDTAADDTLADAAGEGGAVPGEGESGTAQPGEAGQEGVDEEPAGEARQDVGEPGADGADAPSDTPDGQRLYTAQVAAFMSPDPARKWTDRLQSLDLPAWTSMVELEGRTFYRVRVGAVSDMAEARRLGALLTERFEWPVWVAAVTPSDPMPDDAVASTRRVLGD